MLKARLASLLFAVFASLSVAALAAETSPSSSTQAETVQVAQVATINLNTADAATLQRELTGIGEIKAQAIVAYREEHGSFATVDELLEVKGIGAATLEKNRDKLMVD